MPTVLNIKADAPPRVVIVEDNFDSVRFKSPANFCPKPILLDIGLPVSRDYDIAKQLRWEPGLEKTRIIAITALPDADRERAIKAGCDEFYRKPVDSVLLEELLGKRFGEVKGKGL